MSDIGRFFTSTVFLTIVEVAVIVSLAGLLIWRNQKNKKNEELRKQVLDRARDERLTMLLSNDQAQGTPSGSGGRRVRILVSSRSGQQTEEFPEGREILAGREASCDLRLASPYAARRQCVFFWENSRFLVRSLEATNPAVLHRGEDNIRIGNEGFPLSEGDVLTVGDIKLQIRFSGR